MAKSSPYGNVISSDIISFNAGLDMRGAANAAPNTFTFDRNMVVNSQGLLTYRPGKKRWLPDTVETVYQIYPALYGGVLYYFTADDSKIRYCQDGDTAWTDCGGSNTVVTGTDVITTFIRAEDKLYIANGEDKSKYVDLSTLDVVAFTAITDPASAPTAATFGTGLSYSTTSTGTTTLPIYYSITFNGAIGETANSPILTGYTSISRTNWVGDNTYGLTVTRNNSAPTGATSWNLYVATAKSGSSIVNDDMLLLAGGLDIASTTFQDNGSLQPDLNRGTAPSDNSTEGFIAKYGTEINGRLFLWGITDDEYSIRIGGNPGNAFDFTPSNGGYQLTLNKGTNYFPTNVVSFRNSQGIPSLTALFSNTQGVSKQSIIEQNTVNYGDYSFVVWGGTDQGRDVPSSSSPYGVVNYNNTLYFPTVSNIMGLTTNPTTLNLLSVNTLSIPIQPLYNTILSSQLSKVVGCANDNRIYFSWATRGYTSNSQIGVYDIVDPNNPRWYTMDIAAQWIGVVSPDNQRAFIYVCQDNHIFRLEDNYVAQDENADGTATPFPTAANGALTGLNPSHTSYLAIVQVVFYFLQVVGELSFTVQYTNQQGKLKTKTKTYSNGSYQQSSVGGWSSPGYLFNQNLPTKVLTWGDTDVINDSLIPQKSDVRVAIPINDIANEFTWQVRTNLDNSAFILRSISYEGVVVGVKGDVS